MAVPVLEWVHVVDPQEDIIEDLDMGQIGVGSSGATVGEFIIRIYNKALENPILDRVIAKNPICYLTGADGGKLATEGWVLIKNLSLNGNPVQDVYQAVSNNNFDEYKSLAGDIHPGGYIEFSTYVSIPANTTGKLYNWSYVVEYQYSS